MPPSASLLAALALAAAPQPPFCVPETRDYPQIVSVAGAPAICWDAQSDCLVLASEPAADRAIPHPPLTAPAAVVAKDGRKICAGSTCQRLGKKLARAIARAQSPRESALVPVIRVASDISRVVITEPEGPTAAVWSVALDQPLALKAPSGKDYPNPPTLNDLRFVGSTLAATWVCGADCARTVLVDEKGANRGAPFTASLGAPLDADRLVFVGQQSQAVLGVIQASTGRLLGQLSLGEGETDDVSLAVLSPDRVAVLWNPLYGESAEYRLAVLSLDPTPTLAGPVRRLAPCTQKP
jgi:hypothetical protein